MVVKDKIKITQGLGVLTGLMGDNDEKPEKEKVFEVNIDKLDTFPNHSFKLYTGDKLDKLVESIVSGGTNSVGAKK